MAAHIGVPVGVYHQITDDLHMYSATWHPEEWLAAEPSTEAEKWSKAGYILREQRYFDYFPLVKDPQVFDQEVMKYTDLSPQERAVTNWQEPFLQKVAAPMAHVFNLHKARNYEMAIKNLELIKTDDWQLASQHWLEKREESWVLKQGEVDG